MSEPQDIENPEITPDDVLLAILHKLNERKTRGIDLFRKFDTSGDGNISQAEFQEGLQEMDFTASEDMLGMLMSRLDSDGSGEISLKELDRELRHAEKDAKAEGRSMEEAAAKIGLANYGSSRMKVSRATLTKRERANSMKIKKKATAPLPLDAVDHILLKIVDALDQKKTRAKDLFHKLDTSDDNEVSAKEFRAGMDHMGLALTDDELNSVMSRLDKDGSGDISIPELDKTLRAAAMHRLAASRSSLDQSDANSVTRKPNSEKFLSSSGLSDPGSPPSTPPSPKREPSRAFLKYRPPAKPSPRKATVGYSPSMCKTPPKVMAPPDWVAMLGSSEVAAEADLQTTNAGGIYMQRLFVPQEMPEQVLSASPSRPAPLEERQRVEWRLQHLCLDQRMGKVKYKGLVVPPGKAITSQKISVAGVQGALRFWPNGFFNYTQKVRFRGEFDLAGMRLDSWCAVGLWMPAGTHFRLRFFVGNDRSEVREAYWSDASDVQQFWMPPVRDTPKTLSELVVGVEVLRNCRHLRPKEASPRRTPRVAAVLPSLETAASPLTSPRILPALHSHRGPRKKEPLYSEVDAVQTVHGARTDLGLSLPSPRFICATELKRIPPRCAVARAPAGMYP